MFKSNRAVHSTKPDLMATPSRTYVHELLCHLDVLSIQLDRLHKLVLWGLLGFYGPSKMGFEVRYVSMAQVVLATAKELQTRFLAEHKGLSSVCVCMYALNIIMYIQWHVFVHMFRVSDGYGMCLCIHHSR